MTPEPLVQPLPYKRRKHTFFFLLLIFIVALPFLYLYATGYRFEFGETTNLISTGGIYVTAERTGAEIYIDGELVRETRTFRTAFYAQSLEPGTHRVHVQKEDHHTWVKELPVYPHLVTEAQAFNLPLVPEVRVIAPFETATGTAVVATTSFLAYASSTNEVTATSAPTSTLAKNVEYSALRALFGTSSEATTTPTLRDRISETFIGGTNATSATSSVETATTTKVFRNTMLFERDGDVYARWMGSRGSMPYYYCAEDFPRYSTSTRATSTDQQASVITNAEREAEVENDQKLLHPVQQVSEEAACKPEIKLDRRGQEVTSFDFFPGSADHVILGLQDGIYVVEVDDRAWQNMQPLYLGEDLQVAVENGAIYVYDGDLIYQVLAT